MVLHLSIEGDGHLDFDVKKIVISGYTTRDPAGVQKHIEEMKQEGVAVPESFPLFFPKIADRITTDTKIEILPGRKSCGEAEFTLLIDDEEQIYVGIGSDHSDKTALQFSILAGKHMCPGLISKKVWRYLDVKDQWDDIIMRSWVIVEGKRQLYQDGKLSLFIKPEEYVRRLKEQVAGGDLSGMVVYSATLPIIGETTISTPYFEAQLIDEKLGRTLTCAYDVEPITWFTGKMQVS
ncbi:DUF2848 family protein [Chloroflexota bacterium]